MTGTMYGYARVSTREQNLDRQLDALRSFGVRRGSIFADKASGKDFDRPQWHALMTRLTADDVLVVKSIDRLGRDYEEIIAVWRGITKDIGAGMVVLDMPLLDTRRERGDITGVLIADIVLQLLSYVAQIERESIKRRQAEGIAAAKARGVRFGRPLLVRPPQYVAVRDECATGAMTCSKGAKLLGVSPGTLRKWMREDASRRAD